ncbi:MAG: hypothetical protein HYY93_08120 [Planctomycetes bacterium]|nr:hypothetical protein [Planctomycetota bacterium]
MPRRALLTIFLLLVSGEWAAAQERSRSRIGKPMPDVALRDTLGRTIRMSEYKGSTLVILGATTW